MSLWKHPMKVTVFDESSFSEIRVFKGTPRGWLWMAIAGLCAVGGLTFVLVALTPLREVLVPGYVATSTRESMEATQALADSMEQVLQQNAQTVMALRHSLSGDSAALAFLSGKGSLTTDENNPLILDSAQVFEGPGPGELELREQVANEDRFALQRRSGGGTTLSLGFRFPPVVGGVSDALDRGRGHLGVDLVAPRGSAIQAVDDGSVLFSSYTVETGYTMLIQHRGDRVSVYKHCSSLLKQQGDLVVGGEAVALIGNTGALTTGPHLHFEWWVKGQAVDPSPWLAAQP